MGEIESNFEVIIPVMNIDLCNILLKSIEENTLLPKRIIIIDNTEESYNPISSKFPIDIYYSQTKTVNESINLGISKLSDCDFVSILNDDVILGSWFFERIAKVLNTMINCCVLCPHIIVDPTKLPLIEGKEEIVPMTKREGCAFTVKKYIIDAVPPIPDERIKIFHGDDWIWYWTAKTGKIWCKDMGNFVFHKVGSSILRLGFRKVKRPEREEYRKIIKEIESK